MTNTRQSNFLYLYFQRQGTESKLVNLPSPSPPHFSPFVHNKAGIFVSAVDPCIRADEDQVRRQQGEGPRHRLQQGRHFQGKLINAMVLY